jgi:hypothetical protein
MEYELILDDYELMESKPDWMLSLSEPLIKQRAGEVEDYTTTIKNHVNNKGCPTILHGAFLNAFLNIPKSPVHREREKNNYNDGLVKQFQTDTNSGAQSWISELIQNAIDMSAKKISIDITNESLEFSHSGVNEDDGSIFTPQQLSYLFMMNTSSKMGDFTKIGQFGIGFKYWWWFFKQVEVIVSDGNYRHNLSISGDFDTGKTKYTCKKIKEEVQTKFKFSIPKNEDVWTQFVQNPENDIYGDRVLKSLPFIQSRTGGDFEITLCSPLINSELFCKVITSKYITKHKIHLDLIEWGRTGDEPEQYEEYRVTASLDSLEDSDTAAFKLFTEYVIAEYKGSQTLKTQASREGIDPEEFATGKVESAFESAKINLLMTPEEKFGYPANLFVANSDDSKFSAPFIADAPWQLNSNRVTLNMDTVTPKKIWNLIVARFVDCVYSRFMQHCLDDSNNLEYSPENMFNLINRPIGESSILDKTIYPLDEKFNKLKGANVGGIYTFLEPRICHLSSTFGLDFADNNLGMASEELADLWCKLLSKQDGYKGARKWLEGAMHEKLAKVKIANGVHVPVTLRIKDYVKYDDTQINLPRVLCRQLNKGIPKTVKDLLKKPQAEEDQPPISDEQNEMHKKQLDLFDDIVIDLSNKLTFARDGDKVICDIDEDDDIKIVKSCLKLIEKELDNPLIYFVHRKANLPSHTMHMVGDKKPLNFKQTMQKILIEAYEGSLENAGLKDSTGFKSWLSKNIAKSPWNEVVLLKEDGDEYPILTKLPPQSHMLGIVIGLNGKRHLESIKVEPLGKPEPSVIMNMNKPRIYRWGKSNDNEVYVATDKLEEINKLFCPWVDDEKHPLLNTEDSPNWAWSDLSPNGNTGWEWPRVQIEFEDPEIESNILNRMTPVFIDGLHVRMGTTSAGVHKGYRILKSNPQGGESLNLHRKPLNYTPSGPTSAANAIEITHASFVDSSFKDFALLAASVGHILGTKYYPYSTGRTGRGGGVYVNYSEPPTLKPHGQIRILGLMAAITEHHNSRADSEIERVRNLYQLQSIYSSIKTHNLKYQSKSIIYDVPLVRGGTSSSNHPRNIGLFGKFIPYTKKEDENYAGDDGKPRLRTSESFEDLHNNGLTGYSQKEIGRPFEINNYLLSLLYKRKVWLPRLLPLMGDGGVPSNFETKDNYGIETIPVYNENEMTDLLQYKVSNLHRDVSRGSTDDTYTIDADRWAFRWGLNQLLDLISNNPEKKLFCLQWLEHLLKHNLPMEGWAKIKNKATYCKPELSKTPRKILADAITDDIKEQFPNILKLIELKELNDQWPDFLRASLVGSTAEQQLKERRTTKIRRLIDEHGQWVVGPSERTLGWLNKEDSQKLNFIVSDIEYFSKKIVNISEDVEVFYCQSQRDRRKAWNILKDLNKQCVNELILAEDILMNTEFDTENILEEAPRSFKYVNDLFSKLFPQRKIVWHPYSESNSKTKITAGSGCIALKFPAEKISIRAPKDGESLSSIDHDLIAEMLIDVLVKKHIDEEKIKYVIEDGSGSYPQKFYSHYNIPSDSTTQYKFLSDYCANELNFDQLNERLEEAKDEESLKTLLDSLKKKYRDEDSELNNKVHVLNKWYCGVPSIIQDRNSWTGISSPGNPYTVDKNRSIGYYMVGQMELKKDNESITKFQHGLTHTIGDTLRVNPSEWDWFGRYAYNASDGEQYDFHKDAYEILNKSLLEQWLITQDTTIGDGLIRVKGIFVNQDDETFDGKFHRFHLIHIVASLSVYVEGS